MPVQHVLKASTNVAQAIVSTHHGFVTAKTTAGTSLTNKAAVSDIHFVQFTIPCILGTVN